MHACLLLVYSPETLFRKDDLKLQCYIYVPYAFVCLTYQMRILERFSVRCCLYSLQIMIKTTILLYSKHINIYQCDA